MVVAVTEQTFDQEVLQSDVPVLVDFYADWCGPCRMLSPILEEIAAESEDVKVCKVDIDRQTALAERYDVMSIPTLLSVRDGQVVEKAVGYRPKADVMAMLER